MNTFEKIYCGIGLKLFESALTVVQKHYPELKDEISQFPEGFILEISIAGLPSRLKVIKSQNGFQFSGPNGSQPHCIINIKSVNAAFQLFTGRETVTDAYIRNRFTARVNSLLFVPFFKIIQFLQQAVLAPLKTPWKTNWSFWFSILKALPTKKRGMI